MFLQLDECKIEGSVDGDEQVELAFLDASLGAVDVDVADPVSLELELLGLLSSALGNRLRPWRCKQRCSAEWVRCGMLCCKA